MQYRPKQILGTVLILLAVVIVIVSLKNLKKTQDQSSIALNHTANRFRVSFIIQDTEKNDFRDFLKNLDIDENVAQQDLVFELDSTSSAKLAFQVPINAAIDVSGKKLGLNGNTAQKFTKNTIELLPIKIPKSAELAMFSYDLAPFAYSRLPISDETQLLLTETLKPLPGNYFVSFNSGEDFAFYFRSDTKLENIDTFPIDASAQSTTGAESANKVYQLKFPAEGNEKLEVTPVLFENQNLKIFASSPKAAEIVLNTQETFEYPQDNTNQDLDIYFEPREEFDSQKFSQFITKGGIYNQAAADKFTQILSKIKSISFTLKGTAFSALINLK